MVVDPGSAALAVGALGFLGGERANVASARAAQAQMDFQRDLSNTSYQRQVADLKAAGINPMLVSRLGGASTPAGAMPQIQNIGAAAASAYAAAQSSGASAKQAETAETLSESQVKQINATAEKIREEIKNIPIEGERLEALVAMLYEQKQLMDQQNYTSKAQMAMFNATVNKVILETDLVRGSVQAMKQLDNIGKTFEAAKPIIDALKIFLGRGR
uniref:hypothetical protein n=1 Tax=Shewanella sp. TaxID=50422 RepID=UPI004047F62C